MNGSPLALPSQIWPRNPHHMLPVPHSRYLDILSSAMQRMHAHNWYGHTPSGTVPQWRQTSLGASML